MNKFLTFSWKFTHDYTSAWCLHIIFNESVASSKVFHAIFTKIVHMSHFAIFIIFFSITILNILYSKNKSYLPLQIIINIIIHGIDYDLAGLTTTS